MSRFAIIIGVDHYENPAWRLTAAVDDALAFREWALGPGGVPPENVHLLLSPTPGREPSVPYAPADSDHITDLIHEFQRGRGADGERLYFYYAGHGAAAPGAQDEVSILPADVRAFPRDAKRIIGFSEILPPLQERGPASQFFFVDACRDLLLEDFTRGAAPVMGRWRGPPATEAPRRRAQYLLYATSPGGRALEMGRGVFGHLLLQGLKGHPGALLWSQLKRDYELRFSQLAEFVRTEVETQVNRLGGGWRQFLQLPEQDVPPGSSGQRDFILERFTSEQVGKLPLRIRVQPSSARQTCGVSVLYYAPGGIEVPIQTVKPEPPESLPLPVELQLAPGDYTVLAQAAEFGQARKPCALYRPLTVELRIKPDTGMWEPFSGDPFPEDPTHPRPPPGTPPQEVLVDSEDEHARIVVLDPNHEEHTGIGKVLLSNPPAGIYRARLMLPEGPSPEERFEVRPGGRDRFLLPAPSPALGVMQTRELILLGARLTQSRYVLLARELGPMAQPRLASVLGIHALTKRGRGTPLDCGLQVRLSASGYQPISDMGMRAFLAQSRLVLRNAQTGDIAHEGSFHALDGALSVVEWEQAVSPGPWILEISLPHLAPTRYALTALPGHLSTLVVVAEDSGEVDVQQYMARPKIMADDSIREEPAHTGPPPLQRMNLRDLELGQRYLASGTTVPLHHLEPVLKGQCLDPLLGCIAGYALLREGPQRFHLYGSSLMQNMLRFFDALPDAHILAGLCEPEHQQAHFQRALERGLPVFSDGLRILQRHTDGAGNPWFAEASQGLIPGSLWTCWIAR